MSNPQRRCFEGDGLLQSAILCYKRLCECFPNKNRNARKRQKTLKAYDLSELAEILPELSTQRKGPVPLPKPGKKCKSRQTLVLQEANRLQAVFSSPTFQSDPLAAIYQLLQSMQPAPETMARKKSNDDKKKKKKSSAPQSMEM